MKRVLSILVVCVVLFTSLGLTAFAAVPDTTKPVVYGATATPNTLGRDKQGTFDPCPTPATLKYVKITAGVRDGGIIDKVWVKLWAPDGTLAGTWMMKQHTDGMWRAYIPKTDFTPWGNWKFKVYARDYNIPPVKGNTGESAAGWIKVTNCDQTGPYITNVKKFPAQLVTTGCYDASKTHATIQADIWDKAGAGFAAHGVASVVLEYSNNGAGWLVAPMNKISDWGYKAVVGPFAAGEVDFAIVAEDNLGNQTVKQINDVTVDACPAP